MVCKVKVFSHGNLIDEQVFNDMEAARAHVGNVRDAMTKATQPADTTNPNGLTELQSINAANGAAHGIWGYDLGGNIALEYNEAVFGNPAHWDIVMEEIPSKPSHQHSE